MNTEEIKEKKMSSKKTVEVKIGDMEVIKKLKIQFSALKGKNTKLKKRNEYLEKLTDCQETDLDALRADKEQRDNAYTGLQQVLEDKDKEIVSGLEKIAKYENANTIQLSEINDLNSTVTTLLNRIKTGQV
jgi:chromosome segregation ATPase